MSVELIATIQVFQGLKADIKPPDAAVGSTFREIDGIDWIRHEDAWMPAPNYLAMIAQNTDAISKQMGRAHADNEEIVAALKRITKR